MCFKVFEVFSCCMSVEFRLLEEKKCIKVCEFREVSIYICPSRDFIVRCGDDIYMTKSLRKLKTILMYLVGVPNAEKIINALVRNTPTVVDTEEKTRKRLTFRRVVVEEVSMEKEGGLGEEE